MRRVGLLSLVALLLLVTPFVVFLEHYRYPLTNPEIVGCFAAAALFALGIGVVAATSFVAQTLVLAALVTLALDIQLDQLNRVRELGATFVAVAGTAWVLREHAARVLALMMGTILLTTPILPRDHAIMTEPAGAIPSSSNKPFVLHLVLDEHIGVDGFPRTTPMASVAAYVKAFFEERHFLLFGRAYSEYFLTRDSMSQLLNLSPESYRPGLYRKGERYNVELTRNEYFARLAASGFAIQVIQSTYMNVCADAAYVARCEAYDYAGIGELDRAALRRREKLSIIGAAYLTRISAYDRLEELYSKVRVQLASMGIRLPVWPGPAMTNDFAPIAANLVLQRLRSTLINAQRGQYVFAHILAPHYPYVYGPDCSLQTPGQWLDRTSRDAPSGTENTIESRTQRYLLYGQQIRCTYQNIAALLEVIPAEIRRDAIFIVHGDHGSRINVVTPSLPNRFKMMDSDYADAFSTLFAVRSAALGEGYDDRILSITCLLAALHESSFGSLSATSRCESAPKVFMPGPGDDLTPVALPDFWVHRESAAKP